MVLKEELESLNLKIEYYPQEEKYKFKLTPKNDYERPYALLPDFEMILSYIKTRKFKVANVDFSTDIFTQEQKKSIDSAVLANNHQIEEDIKLQRERMGSIY